MTTRHILKTAILVALPAPAFAQVLWTDATADTIGATEGWTHRVELADLDGDGRVDVLFANGGDYSTPGAPEPNQAFFNTKDGFVDRSTEVFGTDGDLTRVIKAGDLNGDGSIDLLVGMTYGGPSRQYLGAGNGSFSEASQNLPQTARSIGDLELGDVDADGDLDVVLVDWGPGDGLNNPGGPVVVWLNDGAGGFVEDASVPALQVRMSWDVDLVDVDNDYDLDILVASKVGLKNELLVNDGEGSFTVASDRLPVFIGTEGFEPMDMNRDGEPEANNYDFAWADFDGDGFLDLVTVNDGDLVDPADMFHRREHIWFNDGTGGFRDVTRDVWPEAANTGFDDNAAVVFDFDSDGDADFFIASLSGPDRLLVNEGGQFALREGAVEGAEDTPGTLGIAFADLNGDARLDYAQSQGELAFDERVYLGTATLPADSAAPIIGPALDSDGIVRVRVHDNKSPMRTHDFRTVEIRSDVGTAPMSWYGEALWSGAVPNGAATYRVCAVDAAGNEACGDTMTPANEPGTKSDEIDRDDATDEDSPGCSSVPASPKPALLILTFILLVSSVRRANPRQK